MKPGRGNDDNFLRLVCYAVLRQGSRKRALFCENVNGISGVCRRISKEDL